MPTPTLKIKFLQVEVPLYLTDLIVIATDDFEAVERHFNIKKELPGEPQAYVAEEFRPYHYVYIVFPEIPDLDTILHEATHACNRICLAKGIELDAKNDEPQAFLMGWIGRQIGACLSGNPVSINKLRV